MLACELQYYPHPPSRAFSPSISRSTGRPCSDLSSRVAASLALIDGKIPASRATKLTRRQRHMRAWQWDHNTAGEATKASIKSTKGITRDWESIPQCHGCDRIGSSVGGHRRWHTGTAYVLPWLCTSDGQPLSTKYQKIGVAVDA